MFAKRVVKVKGATFSGPMRAAVFPIRGLGCGWGYGPKVGVSLEVNKVVRSIQFRIRPLNSSGATCNSRDGAIWRKYNGAMLSQSWHTRQFQEIRVKAWEKLGSIWSDPKREGVPESVNLFDRLYTAGPFGESRQSQNEFRNCSSSLFALMLVFLYASSNDDIEAGSEKAFQTGGLSSILRKLKGLFLVSAANLEEDGKLKSGTKEPEPGAPFSRRKHFNFIADVLDIVQGAVVCIEVKDHSTVNWFGMPQTSSNGSGFIVKEDGLILTNAHVVANQQRCSISVKLRDGRSFVGYVEDVDYESDLATVRVKARGLPTLQLGCSADTRMGEWVVAVGSPLNLSNTVTAGIVSSTRRGACELGISVNDINYIQTDAAITFGNSGGPLINLDAEVIGINSMKVTPGISFAIPIDHAKTFLEKAESRRATGKSKLSRRYMGLTILSLTDEIRRELEIRTGINVVNQGVFVWQVVQGGPAFLAGLQPGDVITKINGKQMISAAQVHEIIKTDNELHVEVQRGEHIHTFTVVPETVS